MRPTPNGHHRIRLVPVSIFLLALALTVVGIAGLASQARSAPVSITFDHGRITLGGIIENREILPATSQFPSDDLPTPQRTDITLNGDLSDGALSFPATTNSGLQFPYMNVLSPTDNTLKVPFTFRLRDPGLTGTFEQATGQAELSGSMDIYVVVGLGASPNPTTPVDLAVPPLGLFGRCHIPNVPVSFSTETKSPLTAERFTGGFGTNGALTAAWEDIPQVEPENVTPEQDELCGQLNGIIHGPGGVWLSNGVVTPQPQPIPEPTCADDLRLCPVPTYTEITRTRLKPKSRSVKPGKTVKLKVTVTNSGNEAATGVTVRIRSWNKNVRAPKSIELDVPAASSASEVIKVKVKRNAKRRAVITATADGVSGSARLKILQPRKKRSR